jgi:hypothetical protein
MHFVPSCVRTHTLLTFFVGKIEMKCVLFHFFMAEKILSLFFYIEYHQVMGLQQRGVKAEFMGSAQTDRTVNGRAENGEFDVLYMTPEKACNVSQRSADICKKVPFTLIALRGSRNV